MSLITCPNCRSEVASLAKYCPSCGCPQPPRAGEEAEAPKAKDTKQPQSWGSWTLWSVVFLVVAIKGGVILIPKLIDKFSQPARQEMSLEEKEKRQQEFRKRLVPVRELSPAELEKIHKAFRLHADGQRLLEQQRDQGNQKGKQESRNP